MGDDGITCDCEHQFTEGVPNYYGDYPDKSAPKDLIEESEESEESEYSEELV